MAKWSISKLFSIVVFIVMMLLFFFWMAGNVSDLGLVFGFRTSHTVANDIANAITSVSGVPGDASIIYEIKPGDSPNRFKYDITVDDKIVCVRSYLSDPSASTSDCASHPHELDKRLYFEKVECAQLEISKTVPKVVGGGKAKIDVVELSRRCQR